MAGERTVDVSPAMSLVDGWVTPEMLLPGRPGVVAYARQSRLADHPCAVRLAFMVAEAHERRVNRHVFMCLLEKGWRLWGGALALVLGSREPVVEWFRYADFSDVTLPWMRQWCGLHLLPARPLILWRGGRGSPAEVADNGMSWTPSRPVAGHYALLQGRGYDLFQGRGDPGPPILLRRRAARDEALAYFASWDREVVVPDAGSYASEAPGVAALERLARASGAKDADRSGRRRDSGDLGGEAAWQGWTG